MAYVDVHLRLRPIRLAHLVDPHNARDILKAIEINTFLWGGTFNPIIPFYRRLPLRLKDLKRETSRSIIAGFVDAFDPDFVVTYGRTGDRPTDFGNREAVSSKIILEGVRTNGTPSFGIGLFELLSHLTDEEFRYVRREPLDIVSPKLGRQYQLFLASVFGYLSPDLTKIFDGSFRDAIEAAEATYDISNYASGFRRNFLRRISGLYQLNLRRERSGFRDAFLFYLDASKPIDIIDFWNLRATGLQVIPIPKQGAELSSTKEFAVNFINRHYYPLRSNADIYHQPTILKSRSISHGEFERFFKELIPLALDESGKSKAVIQDWYPRIWDEWQRKQKHVTVCKLVCDSKSHELNSIDDRISFSSLDPEFITSSGGHGEPRFANEVNLRVYSGEELYAEVIPEGSDDLAKAFGIWSGIYKVRFSASGMVRLHEFADAHQYAYLPKAEDVFVNWLKSKHWEVELSDKGRIAKQMLKRLGGKLGTSILSIDGLIALLGRLSEGKTINEQALNGELAKITQRERTIDSRSLLQRLTEIQMFRLGMELKCPVCTQRSWFSISEADYEVQCVKCLEQFQLPSHAPREIKWSYRSFGAFSLPMQSYGVYAVLLALRFFSVILDSATTPIMSFTAKKSGNEIEVDLGILFQKSKFVQSTANTKLILAECKTYNSFDRKDIVRMQFVGEQFPGSVLVFATLKQQLTVKEKQLLRQIVNRQRKLQSKGHAFNPVLVLTGIELFSSERPPHCWQAVEGIAARFAKWHSTSRDLVHLSDATQQLHLDMPGYEYLPLEEP